MKLARQFVAFINFKETLNLDRRVNNTSSQCH